MIIANSGLRTSLAMYHLISNGRSRNNYYSFLQLNCLRCTWIHEALTFLLLHFRGIEHCIRAAAAPRLWEDIFPRHDPIRIWHGPFWRHRFHLHINSYRFRECQRCPYIIHAHLQFYLRPNLLEQPLYGRTVVSCRKPSDSRQGYSNCEGTTTAWSMGCWATLYGNRPVQEKSFIVSFVLCKKSFQKSHQLPSKSFWEFKFWEI